MSQVIVIKIKKKTLLISLIVFFTIVGAVLFWFFRRNIKKEKGFEEWRKEHAKIVEESKEYAMRQHIKHVDKGLKYDKYCGMCNGDW